MIPATRPTVSPLFSDDMCPVFAMFWKVGTNVRTETCAKILITTGQDCGTAKWINHLSWKKQQHYAKDGAKGIIDEISCLIWLRLPSMPNLFSVQGSHAFWVLLQNMGQVYDI